MGDPIIIRKADHTDLPGIMVLQERSYAPALLEPLDRFKAILDLSANTCFIAECDGTMTGYLLTHPVPDDYGSFGKALPAVTGKEMTLYIHDLCVGPECRGRGVAQSLFSGLVHALQGTRIKTLLGVAVQESPAFWEKCGFTIGQTYTYPGGAQGQVMSRTL